MESCKQIQVAIDSLRPLGLNQLEANVYVTLLQATEPQTAYRLGKTIGKPTANVYKAIAVLHERGAVTIQDGDKQMCSAVAADEFLAQVKREVDQKSDAASGALANLQVASDDERVVQLSTPAAVLERASRMLVKAQKIAVLDIFPGPLDQLRSEVLDAASRGVKLFVQVYQPDELGDANVVLCSEHTQVLEHWKSEQINLVIDGQEALLALLSHGMERIHQATWSNSLYLSCIMHVGLMREHTFHRIVQARGNRKVPSWLDEILNEELFFHTSTIPGQKQLFENVGIST